MNIIDIVKNGYVGYANYLWHEITHPSWHNYFYWLILVSVFFFVLEVLMPWRKNQAILRKDFWLDVFYMFFNFFLFSLIIYNAFSDVVVNVFNTCIKSFTDFDLQASNPMNGFPVWAVLLIGFLIRDFVQWNTHRLLHRVERLWKFHKVHHSVEQMGFAAHLRYHWMETIVYRSIEYIPLALLGIGLYDFFVIHIFTLAIGHYNHSNISIDGKVTSGILGFLLVVVCWNGLADVSFMVEYSVPIKILISVGIMLVFIFGFSRIIKKIFNSPEMHIWHHTYNLPEGNRYGINFGISLAVWDYLFGTAAMPSNGRDIELGFPGVETFPHKFIDQSKYGF